MMMIDDMNESSLYRSNDDDDDWALADYTTRLADYTTRSLTQRQ